MSLIADLVLQTANAPGTATFNLIAAPAGRVSFMTGNGAGQAYYMASDGTSWEKGYGTVVAGSPETLSRDLVLKNSSGTQPSKISFASTVTIISDIPAERAIFAAADNGSVALASRVITGLGAASAADHGPRLDQIAEVRLGSYGVSAGNIVIPTGGVTDPYRIDLLSLQPAASVGLYLRYSTDGGSTFQGGASEYGYQNIQAAGTAVSAIAGVLSYLPLIQTVASTANAFGVIEIAPVQKLWRGQITGYNGTSRTQELPSGNWTTSGTPTHWLISAVSSTLVNGIAQIARVQF